METELFGAIKANYDQASTWFFLCFNSLGYHHSRCTDYMDYCDVFLCVNYIGCDWLVGLIRKFVISSSGAMARNSGNGVISVVMMPVFLVLFVPVYIVLLLIPKIATYDEV